MRSSENARRTRLLAAGLCGMARQLVAIVEEAAPLGLASFGSLVTPRAATPLIANRWTQES